jgi:uncharacterized protein (TIGR02246 family)
MKLNGAGLFLFVCFTASVAQAGPKEDVSAATAKWMEAFGENNTDKVVGLYAKDGVLWGTSSPTVRSDPAAIRSYFEGAFKNLPGIKVSFGEQLVRVYGNVAVNTGYYTFTFPKDGNITNFPARYSLTYVKDGDSWLIADHHSSAVPAPPK